MQAASSGVIDALNKSLSVQSKAGCWIEYNMNDLIDGKSVENTGGDTKTPGGDSTPFVKLFPLTSIIDPRRPKIGGVKYFILNSSVDEPAIKLNYATTNTTPYRLYYPGEKLLYKYWISNRASGTSLDNAHVSVKYPAAKHASVNKISIKFEVSHSKPVNWTVKISDLNNSESTIATNLVVPDSGVVDLYYNGATWSTTKFTTPSSPVDISKITVDVSTISVANSYLGIIEIAGKYIQDVSDRIVSFSAQKSSSNGSSGIVPVGDVTSNSLSLALNSYDGAAIEYDKSNIFDKTKISLYKNITIYPFITINETDSFSQGIFYTDSFTIGEFGDVNITALDGAKFLQEIITPNILIKNTSSQAIIRRLLDSVGFTNYNFNTTSEDSSTITPYYWYSDNTSTVWQHIQDLCKDTQMIATFDENDILQFYTREWLFDKTKQSSFKFRYDNKGDLLSNISSLSKEVVPSVKAVKIFYNNQLSSAYTNSGSALYKAPIIKIGASALQQTLTASAGYPYSATPDNNNVIILDKTGLSDNPEDYVFSSSSGYILIDHEIIEYDAVEYSYVPVNETSLQYKWIAIDSDLNKYQTISRPGTFGPTGKYRIKKRNAFGLVPNLTSGLGVEHKVDVDGMKNEWTVHILDPKTKSSSTYTGLISLTSSDSKGNNVPRSLMTVNEIAMASGKYTIATIDGNIQATTSNEFIVGTSVFFPAKTNIVSGTQTGSQASKGGLAFCLNSDATTGYVLEIGTTVNAANKDLKNKVIQLNKIKNGVITPVSDNQSTQETTFQNIQGGAMYRADVKVSKKVDKDGKAYLAFKIIIDNTLITAVDTDPLPITNKVGLVAINDQASYDYVYGAPLTLEEFKTNDTYNLYTGLLGKGNSLIKKFSDFILSTSDTTSSTVWIKEFGPVAREIKKISVQYSSKAGIPAYAQLTLNPYVTILGYSADSFGMEAYLLNNSSYPAWVSDGQTRNFSLIGDSIVPSDQFEYIDPDLSATANQEQISFESKWIQKESEAKSLSDWMRTQWSKQQTVFTIDVFQNPLIQIGDIVEISYPRASVYSSEDSGQTVSKFIVLDINQTWDQSPTTNLVCRSIYI